MVSDYLDRINYKKKIVLNEETLHELHKQHVLHIPFEDLDIHFDIPIRLNFLAIYNKVVMNRRGGFCYELNYLFYQLLIELGFKADIISSSIYNKEKIIGPVFDHMSIIVTLKDKWLIDVGYGDLFIYPLKCSDYLIKKDWFKNYKIDKTNTHKYLLSESLNGIDYTKRYEFDTQPRRIEDFQEQCDFKQYSNDSYFVQNLICTLPNPKGRITIFNNKLIVRKNTIRKEYTIKSNQELSVVLNKHFNIDM